MLKNHFLMSIGLVVSLMWLSLFFAPASQARVPVPGEEFGGVPELEVAQQEFTSGVGNSEPSLGYTTYQTSNSYFSYLVLDILGGKPLPVPYGAAQSDSSIDPTDILPGNQGSDASGRPNVRYSRGAVGALAEYTGILFANPPARTDVYIADVMNSAGFAVAQPAYAQGLGFASLSPVLSAWKAMRNLSYFFFVLIFLVIGFMIMLRHKVGGQAAITAQQAIPRIIVSLLAVTFSYAIAGLVIDGMYLFMFMLIGIFGSNTDLINMNFIDLATTLVTTGGSSVYDVVKEFVSAITSDLGFNTGGVLEKLGGLSIAVIVAIAILFGVFKLFFILLRTYISVLVSIVLSPLLLMMGAIPGKNVFGSWVKSLIGNLAAFPVTLLILLIYEQLTGAISGTTASLELDGGFMPPYLIGAGSGNMVVFLIGFGMILIIGDLVTQAKDALGAGKGPFDVLAQNVADALKKGWEGGQLVPGLGFTDTRKLPMGGLSGANVIRKGGIVGAGAVGGGTAFLGNVARQGVANIPRLKTTFVPGSEYFTEGKRRKQFGELVSGGASTNPLSAGLKGIRKRGRQAANFSNDPQLKDQEKK